MRVAWREETTNNMHDVLQLGPCNIKALVFFQPSSLHSLTEKGMLYCSCDPIQLERPRNTGADES
jgi:hypothetical protein